MAGIPDVFTIPEYLDRKHSTAGPALYPVVLGLRQLQELALEPSVLRYVRMRDESMPPLRVGDLSIIDTSDTLPQDGRVYLIKHPRAGSIIRRVFFESDGAMVLRPDSKSPMFREELITPDRLQDVRILGRAVLTVLAVAP